MVTKLVDFLDFGKGKRLAISQILVAKWELKGSHFEGQLFDTLTQPKRSRIGCTAPIPHLTSGNPQSWPEEHAGAKT
jgi:hypothetical protein